MIPGKYYLLGTHCANCSTDYFPERQICPKCRRHSKLSAKKMPDKGKIYSFTEVHAAPTGFEYEAPYFLAIVELDNGVKLLSQIVDTPENKIVVGAPVEMRFRRVGEDDHENVLAYGYKFAAV
jgi:uncharacterized OB-fold protein